MVSIKESTKDGTIVPGKHAQTKTQHHRLLVLYLYKLETMLQNVTEIQRIIRYITFL